MQRHQIQKRIGHVVCQLGTPLMSFFKLTFSFFKEWSQPIISLIRNSANILRNPCHSHYSLFTSNGVGGVAWEGGFSSSIILFSFPEIFEMDSSKCSTPNPSTQITFPEESERKKFQRHQCHDLNQVFHFSPLVPPFSYFSFSLDLCSFTFAMWICSSALGWGEETLSFPMGHLQWNASPGKSGGGVGRKETEQKDVYQ